MQISPDACGRTTDGQSFFQSELQVFLFRFFGRDFFPPHFFPPPDVPLRAGEEDAKLFFRETTPPLYAWGGGAFPPFFSKLHTSFH